MTPLEAVAQLSGSVGVEISLPARKVRNLVCFPLRGGRAELLLIVDPVEETVTPALAFRGDVDPAAIAGWRGSSFTDDDAYRVLRAVEVLTRG